MNSVSDYELEQPTFHLDSQAREPRNLLLLTGQVGSAAAAQLRDEVENLASTGRGIDVDWSDAETVTAGCIQVLLALGVSLSDRGQTLRVTGDNPKVRGLLELAGLSSRFPVPELA